ncbi:MAG: Stp1/IreP family PP2C-type Ser/Thr phosphatase [Alphaproteobacteria bacterium]|nr:Stp1/IreP family PP2C-type Ser/Thr phosphatase [Alphaproteobacteria bacterium]
MEYSYLTDPGKVRDHNEDSVTIVKNKSGEILMAVADGMGGHKGGEIASSIAITNIGARFMKTSSVGNKEDAIAFIKEIVSEANMNLYRYTQENPESLGMGTTIVLALLTKDFLLFGNIGDSSGFVIKDGKLYKITQDHTLVNLLVKSGELTEEEGRNHPRKNVLMRALGANINVEMDIFDVETDVDGIFLCSDGLTNMLDNEQIENVLNGKLAIDEKLQKLILKSNNRGGTDNISVAYLNKEGQ